MVTILLIADQARLEGFFGFTQESSQITFRMCRSLHQGAEEMAAAAPDFLFIQNHLSGLSGEILARHLTSGLVDRRPTVVLFGEGAECVTVPGVIDDCLDIAQEDETLSAAIIGLIAGTIPQKVETSEGEHTATEAVETPELKAEPFTPSQTEVAEGASPAVEPSPFDQKLQTAMDEALPPVPLAEIEEQVTLDRQAAPSLDETPKGQPHRKTVITPLPLNRSVVVGALVLVVAAVALYFAVSHPTKSVPPRPAGPVSDVKTPTPSSEPQPAPPGAPSIGQEKTQPATAPAAAAPAGMTELPAFIPRQGADRTYGVKNPGWERYLGARTEFKVYRETGVIRAIQSIDRSGVGIPESFMRGALEQMTRVRTFSIDEKETKGSFHVEKGTTTSGARILIYRTAPRGSIRAFVVYFP